MVRSPYWLIGNDPDAGKDWGQEEKGEPGWDGWMASTTQWTWVWANSGRQWGTRKPGCCSPWGCRVWYDWVTEQQQEFLWGIKSIFSADEAFSRVFGTYKVFINESHCYYYYWLCVSEPQFLHLKTGLMTFITPDSCDVWRKQLDIIFTMCSVSEWINDFCICRGRIPTGRN